MKRVVYVAHRFPVVTETFTINEIAQLRAHGVEVTTRSLRPPPSDLPDELQPLAAGVRTPSLANAPRTLPALARRAPMLALSVSSRRRALTLARGLALAAEVDGERDHIHVQFPLDAASVGLYAARTAGATFSFSGHTLHQLELMPEKLAAATFVTVGSNFEKRVLCERYGDRFADRIHVRRLGVPPRDRDAAAEPQLVVTVGTLGGKKGHDVLLRALAHIPHARLEIIGEGPERARLEALAQELALDGRVAFRGALGHTRTLQAVAHASVFALCCRETADGDHDCLPVALMDAMSLGVPCVSSDAFGIPELIEDGVSGVLAPPEDDVAAAHAIEQLLEDGARAAEIGAAGRAVVRERYDLDRNTAALADLFVQSVGD